MTGNNWSKGIITKIATRLDNASVVMYQNVYVDLHGHIRSRKNPGPGLYFYDGQVFYRKKQK